MAAKSAGHIACPKCGQKYRWNPDKIGKNVNCVKCGHIFAMPEEPIKRKSKATSASSASGRERKPIQQKPDTDASVASAADLRSERTRRKLGNKGTTAVSKKSLFEDDEVLSKAYADASAAPTSRSSKKGLKPVEDPGASGLQADSDAFDEASIAEGIKGLEREVNKEALLEDEGPRWWVPARDYFIPAVMLVLGVLMIFPVFSWGTHREYVSAHAAWTQEVDLYERGVAEYESQGYDTSALEKPGEEPPKPGIVTYAIQTLIVVLGSVLLCAIAYVISALFLGVSLNDTMPVALLKIAGIVLFPAAGGTFLIIITGNNAFLGLGNFVAIIIAGAVLFQLDFFRLSALSILMWLGYIIATMAAIRAF